jgi:hypothetical protein
VKARQALRKQNRPKEYSRPGVKIGHQHVQNVKSRLYQKEYGPLKMKQTLLGVEKPARSEKQTLCRKTDALSKVDYL